MGSMLRQTCLLFLTSFCISLYGEDLKTIDGKEYLDIQDVKVHPERITFVTTLGAQSIDFLKLSQETRDKYHYDPFAAGIVRGMRVRPGLLKKDMAFSLDKIDDAKALAISSHRPLGFLQVWDQFFMDKSDAMLPGGNNAAWHFYNTFKDSMVLVFVSHERERTRLPPAAAKGLIGPDEGGFSPCLCVVSSDLADYITMIPLGGEHSDGKIRHGIFTDKIAVVKAYLDKKAQAALANAPGQ